MNLDEIKSILQLMEANKLVEFEYEDVIASDVLPVTATLYQASKIAAAAAPLVTPKYPCPNCVQDAAPMRLRSSV